LRGQLLRRVCWAAGVRRGLVGARVCAGCAGRAGFAAGWPRGRVCCASFCCLDRVCGDQYTGLRLLLAGLLSHQVPINETVRVRLAVVAEAWGEREFLTPQILDCLSDNEPSRLNLASAVLVRPDPGTRSYHRAVG
jgi:hypothetical protein